MDIKRDMEDIKEFIIQFIEENEEGNINDIIKFVIKRNIELKENLSKLQESIELILKSLSFVRFSEITKKFYFIHEQTHLNNKFVSYKNHIIADIINNFKREIDFRQFYEFLKRKVGYLGKLTQINTDTKESIDGFFETDIIQVSFTINQTRFMVTSMMKSSFESPEPLFSYLTTIPNESIKKDRSIYIPLNFGLFLIYKNFSDYLKLIYSELKFQVYDIEYFY